jgi:CNT family concentrative nucleoside transporter
MLSILGVCYLFSTNRKAIKKKIVLWGLGLQIVFAYFVLATAAGRDLFAGLGDAVNKILAYSYYGSKFVFGGLGAEHSKFGVLFAFQIMPTVIFIAALTALFYYWGVLPYIVKQMAKAMAWLLSISGAEATDVASSIFLDQSTAPLTIKPYLQDATYSELMTIMTAGMAHVSGGILAAYIAFGIPAKHLITAVIMTAPGTLVIAKMLVPEVEKPKTMGKVEVEKVEQDANALAALSRGTMDGLWIALAVVAMLIAFISVIYLCDGIMGGVHHLLAMIGFPYFPATLQKLFGWIFAPVAWLIGVPWHDAGKIGDLLGTRMVLNELIAFKFLGQMKHAVSHKAFVIATYALCGFANFGSVGIQLGAIGQMAPGKKKELAKLGMRAMLAGTMANLMSASIAGIMLR